MADLMDDLSTADVLARMPKGKAREAQRRIRDLMLVSDPGIDPVAVRDANYTPPTVGKDDINRAIVEATGIPGTIRSGRDLIADPSLANATDFGTRAAMTAMRPAAALKILGSGYAAALAHDLMGPVIGSAEAQGKGKGPETPPVPGLTPAQAAELADAKRKVAAGAFQNGAARRALEGTISRLEGLSADYVRSTNAAEVEKQRAQAASAQREYDSAVEHADRTRADILAKDKSFSTSDVGKIYDKTGGFTPLLAGVAGGAVGRLAHGGGGSLVKSLGIPAAEGAGLTFAALNAPLMYDAFNTPALNPQREATEAYARELPDTHPKKAEAAAYAKTLPELNPVRTDARAALFSIPGQIQRLGTGILEGGPAGMLGGNLGPASRRILEGVGEVPGAVATGYQRGMARASAARGTRAAADASALETETALAEARRRRGEQMGGNPPPQMPLAEPAQPPRPSPVGEPVQSPMPSQSGPPAVVGTDIVPQQPPRQDLLADLSLKPNRVYAEKASPKVQRSLLDVAERGDSVSGTTAASLARELKLPPTQAKDAMANLKKIAAATGMDVNDPAQLRALMLRLNADPRFANKSGTGSSLLSIAGPAIAAPAIAGGMGLLSDQR